MTVTHLITKVDKWHNLRCKLATCYSKEEKQKKAVLDTKKSDKGQIYSDKVSNRPRVQFLRGTGVPVDSKFSTFPSEASDFAPTNSINYHLALVMSPKIQYCT